MTLTELQTMIDDLRSELSAVQAINHSRELDNAELRKLLSRPFYERICECGDFESQHQGGGPCEACCQSDRPADGCEVFRPAGFEKLTDVQKGINATLAKGVG